MIRTFVEVTSSGLLSTIENNNKHEIIILHHNISGLHIRQDNKITQKTLV